jgi:hypothetical protein
LFEESIVFHICDCLYRHHRRAIYDGMHSSWDQWRSFDLLIIECSYSDYKEFIYHSCHLGDDR